jgi:hypothetical protein
MGNAMAPRLATALPAVADVDAPSSSGRCRLRWHAIDPDGERLLDWVGDVFEANAADLT